MNLDVMRKVDYYVGVPLCFLGTIAARCIGLFTSRPKDSGPKNILLIELSEMGSAILVDPAMQKLTRHDGSRLFFAIFTKNLASLRLLGTVPEENIYTIDENSPFSFVRDTLGFFVWTRRKRIDAVIDLELFSRFTALLTGFSGARRRVGFYAFHNEGLYRGSFLTHRVAYNPHQHMAKNFIALVNALISSTTEVPYSKTVIGDHETVLRKAVIDERDTATIRRKLSEAYPAYQPGRHRIVLFNTNASQLLPLRRWPQRHYIALAGAVLAQYPDVIILLTGGGEDHDWLETIASAVGNDRCINFAGRTRLTELPALYATSTLMLSNDSGPPHFASVTDMPVFVFFGPETPSLYLPLGNATPIYAGLACSPCVSAWNHRKTACTDNICLQVIGADRVLELLRPLLDGRGA